MDYSTDDTSNPESITIPAANSSLYWKIKGNISRHNLTTYAYVLFLTSFFFVPFEKLYKLTFYLGVIPLFFLSADRGSWRLLKRSLMFRVCVLWLTYLSLTLIWSPGAELSDFDDVARGLVLLILFVAATIEFSWRDEHFNRRLFACLSIVAPLAAATSILAFYATHSFGTERLTGLGVLNHPITAAYFYAIVALITFFAVLESTSSRLLKGLLLGALAILLAYVVLTASRGPMLALCVAVVAGAVLTRNRLLIAGFVVVGVTLALIGIVQDVGPYNVLARASNHRVEIWLGILDRIAENFWFGNGIKADAAVLMSNGGTARHAHQLFLGNHFYGGVPATVLLLILLATAARVAIRHFLKTGQVVHVTLLVFVVVAGMVDFGVFLRSPNLIWFYFWFPVVLIAGLETSDHAREQSNSEKPIDPGMPVDGQVKS